MKNQVLSNVRTFSKSLIAPAALVFMLIAGTVPSDAQAIEKRTVTQTPVKITFLGREQFQPVFQIDIDNREGEELYVNLKDEDGGLLYSEKFNDQKYSKKFRFDTYEPTIKKVTLSLTGKNSKKTQVLEFANVVTTVEDVVVTPVSY